MVSPSVLTNTSPLAHAWRTFRVAAWLGWQVESNWTEPLMFFIYAVLRPISTALILLLMYVVIAGNRRGEYFDYLYISNALYLIVMQAIANMSWTVVEDREHYRMLKYIHTAPVSLLLYLIGRAVARFLIGLTTSVLLLVVGAIWLGLHISLGSIAWGWLAMYFVIGIPILLSFGIVIGGCALVIGRNGEFMGEMVAGMLLLVCSVYFPPDILPVILRNLSLAMPVTYWLEAMRRALTGGILQYTVAAGGQPISQCLAQFTNTGLAGILSGSALVLTTSSYFFYRWVERLAKTKGMIDRITGF